MEANQSFVDSWILKSITKSTNNPGPTGFAADQTIKYGVLPAGFLALKEGVDPAKYEGGTNNPAYQAALATWTAKRGKDLQPVTDEQMKMIDQAFAAIGKFVGVTFVRDDANANIRFGTADLKGMLADDGVSALAGYSTRQYTGNAATNYNVVVMPRSSDENGDGQEWAPGEKAHGVFVTLMHEIEHALGLAHPGDYTKCAPKRGQAHLVPLTSFLRGAIDAPKGSPISRPVVAGKLNKQIADQLDISMKTVEAHRARVMEKMGVRTLAELVKAVMSVS